MIHGVRTIIKSESMTDKQANNVAKIWNRRTHNEQQ